MEDDSPLLLGPEESVPVQRPGAGVVLNLPVLLAFAFILGMIVSRPPAGQGELRTSAILPVVRGRALIVVVLLYSNPLYRENVAYFVEKAVRCWQDADYRIIVQHDDPDDFRNDHHAYPGFVAHLPPLPSNARYVLHKNECWDWGSFGWLLSLPPTDPNWIDTSRYRYFAMINSGVRGPLLPDYLEERMDPDHTAACTDSSSSFSWFDVFFSKIRGATRYVGPTINCAPTAHVQSYAVFFDFVALQVLWQSTVPLDNSELLNVTTSFDEWRGLVGPPGPVFSCQGNKDEQTLVSEIGASYAILRAGYNIGSLMRTWQDVDFRKVPSPCLANGGNKGRDPLVDPIHNGAPVNRDTYGGKDPLTEVIMLDPLWVVFGKFKEGGGSQSFWRLKALLYWEGRWRSERA